MAEYSNPKDALNSRRKRALQKAESDLEDYQQWSHRDVRRAKLAREGARTAGERVEANPLSFLMGGVGPAQAMFLGPMAKGAPLDRISKAMDLAKKGMSAEDIYHLTRGRLGEPGISFGAEGLPRWEISDELIGFQPYARGEIARLLDTGKGIMGRAKDVVRHPELFARYPELERSQMILFPHSGKRPTGHFDTDTRQIQLEGDPSLLPSSIAHEFQHGVQNIEGFASGGNPKFMEERVKDRVADLSTRVLKMAEIEAKRRGISWSDAMELLRASPYFARMAEEATTLDKATKNYAEMERLYARLAGEVEARNTQTRLLWDLMKRANIFPEETADIPRNMQILRMR